MRELIELSGALAVMALTMGPVLLWAALLNLRDRRQARLRSSVLALISSRDLLGRISLKVRSGVLGRKSVVTVHVLGGSERELWELLTRLARRLSPRIRLELSGQMDGLIPATLTVKTRTVPPFPRPLRPTLDLSEGGHPGTPTPTAWMRGSPPFRAPPPAVRA